MALYRCGGGGDDITSATIVSESTGTYTVTDPGIYVGYIVRYGNEQTAKITTTGKVLNSTSYIASYNIGSNVSIMSCAAGDTIKLNIGSNATGYKVAIFKLEG